MEFVKALSASEAKYKYVGLSKRAREDFPAKDEPFDVKFKGKKYKMKANNRDYIMLTQLYDAYQFVESDRIKLTCSEDVFELDLDRL